MQLCAGLALVQVVSVYSWADIMHACTYLSVCVCVRVCMYLCVCMSVCVQETVFNKRWLDLLILNWNFS